MELNLTDSELQEVCDETGFARVDVVRVLKAVAAAAARAHVQAQVNAQFTAESIAKLTEQSPYMKVLMSR